MDKTEVQQKRYRYTDKERDDNSGLYYYELVAGLRVVFATFTEDVGANVQGAALLFCLIA
jgi:hypothetical protein